MAIEIVEADSVLEGEFHNNPLYGKFIEAYRTEKYEVLTNNGWVNIEGIGKTIEYSVYNIETSGGKKLRCADKHILQKCDNLDFDTKKCDSSEVYTMDLELGDFIMTKDGPEMVMCIIHDVENKENMYDLQLDRSSNKLYLTNDIISHNSLWMQNIAVNAANSGKNVLYITLEMSVKKILKRLGSMRLKIPIDDYDEVSMDTETMKEKIEAMKRGGNGGIGDGLFENNVGKILTKFYPAGTSTITDFDQLVNNIIVKKGMKIDMIIVDYITLMAPVKGMGIESNLYLKGKHLAEGLRSMGAKYDCPVITAVQIAKDAWGASDITMDQIPESKAILETCDVFLGIIRTEEMKLQNNYRLKLLKQRDGDFSHPHLRFELNPKYLTIENGSIIPSIV